MLQRGDGVHERLEGASRFDGELGLLCLRVDEPAEHHAIVRRIVDGEPNVGNAHGMERPVVPPAFLPRGNKLPS